MYQTTVRWYKLLSQYFRSTTLLASYVFSPKIVIDFIPHVRAHFETCYHERKQLTALSQNGPKTHETSPSGGPTSAAETKQMEALQRQFDQVSI